MWGDYDSEQHIEFSKDATEKLFSLISLDEFIALCRKEHLIGLDKYLNEKGIERKTGRVESVLNPPGPYTGRIQPRLNHFDL